MIYDEDTGEVIKDKFAQLYFKDIEKLFRLTTKEKDLLFLMSKSIGLGNKNSLNMTPKRKKEFAKKIGVTTSNSISNMLRSMEGKDILKRTEPEEYPNRYTINPDIVFSGNEHQRVKILIEYSEGKRKLKSFSSEDSLIKYLKQNKKDK